MFDLWKPVIESVLDRMHAVQLPSGQSGKPYLIREVVSKRVILTVVPQSTRFEDIQRFEKILTQIVSFMNGDTALNFDRDAKCFNIMQLKFGTVPVAPVPIETVEEAQAKTESGEGIIQQAINVIKRKRGRPKKVAA